MYKTMFKIGGNQIIILIVCKRIQILLFQKTGARQAYIFTHATHALYKYCTRTRT